MSDSAIAAVPTPPTAADLLGNAEALEGYVKALAECAEVVAEAAATLADRADKSLAPYRGEVFQSAEWIAKEGVGNYDSLVRDAEDIVALCKLSADREQLDRAMRVAFKSKQS
jgi:hypothetical protein